MSGFLAQQSERLNQKYGTTTNIHEGWQVNQGTIGTRAVPNVNTSSNNFLGNVFNSIKSGVQAVPGIVGGVANDWYKHAQTTGKGIAQFAPNILFGVNSVQKNGKGGGYVPGLAGLIAPWATPLMQKYQADPNSAGKASSLDEAFATPYAQISDVNKRIDNQTQQLQQAHAAFQRGQINQAQYNAAIKGVQIQQNLNAPTLNSIGQNMVNPKEFNYALADIATTPFAFGKFQGIGKAGSVLSRAEQIFGASKEAQPFLPTGVGDVAKTLIKAPFKQELINKPNVESAMELPSQIAQGHYKDAVMNAGSFLVPGVLAGGAKVGKAAGKFIGKNIFDTSGVFDIVKLKGDKSVNQALTALKSEAKTTKDAKILRQAKLTENKLRVLQDVLLQEANGNQRLAAQKLAEYQSSMNQFDNMELDQFLKEATQHFTARLAAQKIEKSGAIAEDVLKNRRVAIARLTEADRTTIVNAIKQSDDAVATVKALRKDGTIKNNNLYGQLLDIAKAKESNALKAERVQSITAANPLLLGGKTQEFGNGYFAMLSDKAIGTIKKVDETKQLITGNEAKLGKVGELLRKAGISPEEVTAEDNKFVFNKFKTEFLKRIDGIDGRTGDNIYDSLNKLADKTVGVTDIRQLSKRKISQELNLSLDEAGKIAKEAKDSYKVLSVAERGLAGKLMDLNLRVNPLAAPYSRVQSVARYEKNPFFRLQENIETRAGVAAMGGKQAMPLTDKYEETIKLLNSKDGIFSSGYAGEGADPFSGSFSGVTAKLSRDQQANIAATIEKFAGGPDKVQGWIKNPKNKDLLNDFKTIVQYPDKGFTSSNMAKMMNLVAFPSRYNLKVTQFAVKQLMKQPAMTQVAIIRGLKDFNDFTKTPEGIKWQADNKEALGLLSYFTPIQPIKSVFDTLTGQNKSLGEVGMVGGLPFGVLTRILQGQGVLKDRVPYVDPKTGKVYSDRVPEDLKARAESLLNSIIDTLYTYPGRVAGLETSKKQATQSIVDNATFGQLKDGQYTNIDRSGDVTEEQRKQIQILQSMQGNLPKGQLANSSASTPNVNKPIPLTPRPKVAPVYKKAKAKKGKKVKAPSIPISRLI